MSGFAAVSGPHDASLTSLISRAGRHRGVPEVWTSEDLSLVSFTGIGGALRHDGPLHIAFDGRIDERPALATALGRRLMVAQDVPGQDAELVLEAWRRWGERCLPRLIGDFAFALYDERDRSLAVVRDRIGARPAFLAQAGLRVLIATDPGMILADPGVDADPDERWVALFLAGCGAFGDLTPYGDIRRVMPGTLGSVKDGHVTWHHWYRLQQGPRIWERSDVAYAERFGALLAEAVRCRLPADGPVAVPLSGGLDSTSVLSLAAQTGADVVAVTMTFPEDSDEPRLAQTVAARAGVRHEFVDPSPYDPFGDPPATFAEQGGPFSAPNVWMTWVYHDRIRDLGASVVLDGVDGDSVVAGQATYLSDLLLTGRLRALHREADELGLTWNVDPRAVVSRHALRACVPPGLRRAVRRARRRPRVPAWLGPSLVGFAEDALAHEVWRPFAMYRAGEFDALDPGLLSPVLEVADRASAARDQDVRHPFLDSRLVEFCLGLPRTQKVRRGWHKVVLRNAMAGVLPEEVRLHREKWDIGSGFVRALSGPGASALRAGLTDKAVVERGWVRPDTLPWDGSSDGLPEIALWRIAMLSHWLRWLQERRRGFDEGLADRAARGTSKVQAPLGR